MWFGVAGTEAGAEAEYAKNYLMEYECFGLMINYKFTDIYLATPMFI